MKRELLLSVLLMPILAFSGLVMHDFENRTEMDIVIDVPWYPNPTGDFKSVSLTLKPGDIYKAKKGGNGSLLYNMGKAPGFFQKGLSIVDDSNPNEEEFRIREKMYSDSTNIVNCKVMPDFWVTESTNYFWKFREKKLYQEKYYIGTPYASITNLSEKALSLVSDPKADPDGDGLDNMTEFQCGTSPIIKDTFALNPRVIGVEPAGNVSTGYFSIVNCTSTDAVCRVSIYFWDRSVGLVYLGMTNSLDKINGYDADVFIGAKSSRQLAFTLETAEIPVQFEDRDDWFFDFKGNFINVYHDKFHNFKFCLTKRYKPSLTPDEPIAPDNGSVFDDSRDIVFRWKMQEENEGQWPRIYRVDENGFIEYYRNLQPNWRYYSGEIDKPRGLAYLKFVSNIDIFKPNKLTPGLYVWRIESVTKHSCPVSSDWRWFVIPAVVSNTMPERTISNCNVEVLPLEGWGPLPGISNLDNPLFQLKKYIGGLDSYRCLYEKRVLLPLPEGITYQRLLQQRRSYDNNSLSNIVLSGTIKQPGLYTNLMEKIELFEDNETRYKIVRKPFNIYVGGYRKATYDYSKAIVMHKIFSHEGYGFPIADAYGLAFTNQNCSLSKMKSFGFENGLPEGLFLAQRSDGLFITGMPVKYCQMTNMFIAANDSLTNRQVHVFSISERSHVNLETVQVSPHVDLKKFKVLVDRLIKKEHPSRELKEELER